MKCRDCVYMQIDKYNGSYNFCHGYPPFMYVRNGAVITEFARVSANDIACPLFKAETDNLPKQEKEK